MLKIKPETDFRTAQLEKAKTRADAQIERINELSKMARGTWFSLLGYLAFVGVTLLAVEDADFFVSTRKTDLPIVNIPIPTASFFIFGPILGTALFVYLHLYLIRLWDALSQAPEKIGDTPLSEKVMPWLINDFGLAFRKDDAFKNRPMDWLSHLVTALLVFIAAPVVMGAFWIRHWPSHDLLVNLGLAFLFSLTVITALVSYFTAKARLRDKTKYQKGQHLLALIPFVIFLAEMSSLSVLKTEKGAITTGILSLSRANLEENDLVGRPADWLAYDDQKRAFRKEFCKGEDLPPAVCGPTLEDGQKAPIIQKTIRENWVEKNKLDASNAKKYFASLETRFQSDWKTKFKARTAALPVLNLQSRDLRNTNAYQVFLSGADMRGAKLQEADLFEAKLQGADLRRAKLQAAHLFGAKLQEVDLRDAELQGADLRDAELQGADLRDAKLQDADLTSAELQGADLRFAELQGADLRFAELQGADLRFAVLRGADLRGTKLQEADLTSAKLQEADLTSAKLQEADLTSAKLQEADLSRAELQGAVLRLAKLQDADLRFAKLQDADLRNAKLQGANFREAKLQDADLRGAELQGANLSFAKLQRANLRVTKLQRADLDGAELQGANLRFAELQRANLSFAKLRGAVLWGAELHGVVLRLANLRGADLRGAKLKSVEWAEVRMHALAHSADLRGSIGLTQNMLRNVIGDENTLLFASEGYPPPLGRYPLHVWSCWLPDNPPPNLDQLLEQNAFFETKEEIRAQWICPEGTEPQPTGTTKPLDEE